MKYIDFDSSRPLDMVLLGRVAIDFNPTDYYKPLAESSTFKKYVGGSPANIAVGLSRLGKKCGFFGRVSDDQFGDFVINFFREEGVDVSHIRRCEHGEKLGLTFTEILSPKDSSILMYRNKAADLALTVNDIDEEYIKSAKAILISGTALAESPSREAALKAVILAKRAGTPVVFDIDYRAYNWQYPEAVSLYYWMVAREAAVILGSREEYDLTEALAAPGMDDAQSAAYWHGMGAKIVVIKHGREGSTAYANDGGKYSIKPFPIKKLKSFGGGDGYGSAFLYGVLEGLELIDCLELGSASASLLVASHACAPDMPALKKLKTYIADCKQQYGEMIARA
jgi:5-dehydro-2-deoxygluconokinase